LENEYDELFRGGVAAICSPIVTAAAAAVRGVAPHTRAPGYERAVARGESASDQAESECGLDSLVSHILSENRLPLFREML
jgi:hypothetical protein